MVESLTVYVKISSSFANLYLSQLPKKQIVER